MKKTLLLFSLLCCWLAGAAMAQGEFITRWDLSKSGSGATQITLGVGTTGTVNYTWTAVAPFTGSGSGTFTSSSTITGLPSGGIIDLSISPTNFNSIRMENRQDAPRLTQIRQWGTTAWASMEGAFYGCSNMTLIATDVPNTAAVTNMSGMFRGCTSFNQALPVGFNTSNVTNMSGMFQGCAAYNQALPASFNTEKAIDMSAMFQGCTVFNQPLPAGFKCKVANNVSYLFANASAFNQNLVGTFIFPDGNINMEGLFDNCGLDVIHYTAVKADLYGNITGPRYGSWGGTVGAAGMKSCGRYLNTIESAYETAINEVEWGGYYLTFQGDAKISCDAGIVGIVGTNPTTCSGTDGKIAFVTTTLTGAQTLSYKKDGNATTAPINITTTNVSIGTFTVVRGVFELTGLGAGVYSDFAIGSTTPTGSQTLGDPASCGAFITRWDLSKDAGSGATQISFGVGTTGPVSYTWAEVGGGGAVGSGTLSVNNDIATITGLPSGGIIDLSISPTNFNRIYMGNSSDRRRLMQIKQWGTTAWASMQGAFAGCSNMTLTATDVPNTAAVTDMSYMFSNCTFFNQALPEGFNTAAVTTMRYMFERCTAYNQALPANLNTEKVTDMYGMFYYCTVYDKPLPPNLNTAAVTDMSFMFKGCTAYNQALPTNLNTEKVTYMSGMFEDCEAYNQALPEGFNTAAVTDMGGMFQGCKLYNQALPASFNTENVAYMYGMFSGCTAYNQALPDAFNTEKVTNMSRMFYNCTAYNKQLPDAFNTAKVTDMSFMFYNCINYNKAFPPNFNTAAVTEMYYMFSGATAFNQSLASFTLNPNVDLDGFLDNSGLNVANYDATLSSFKPQAQANNIKSIRMGAQGLKYCAAEADNIILEKPTAQGGLGWNITGDDKLCGPTITVAGTLNPFSACAGTASAEQNFTVSGSALTADITVTAPTGFLVSNTSGSGFGASVSLTQSGGAVASTPIYVRMVAAASPSGSVSLSSTGATPNTVAVSGSVTASPTVFSVTGGGDVCPGSTGVGIGLSGSQVGVNYQLKRGATNVALLPGTGNSFSFGTFSTVGTYTVEASNASGCTSTMTGSASVGMVLPISAQATASSALICSNQTLRLTATPNQAGLTYNWRGPANFGSTLQSPTRTGLTTAMSGVYSVTINRSACNLPSSATVSVVVSPSGAAFAPQMTALAFNNTAPNAQNNTVGVCAGSAVMLNISANQHAVTYNWRGPAGAGSGSGFMSVPVNGVTNASAQISAAVASNQQGQYTVTVRNGCNVSNHRVINLQVRNCTSTRLAAAEESGLELNINLAPNPVRDYLTASFEGVEGQTIQVQLIDAQGRRRQQTDVETANGKAQLRLDVRSLPAGMYLLQAETETQRATKKVIRID